MDELYPAITEVIKNMIKEIIICSAVKYGNKIWRGHRHSDALNAMHNELSYDMSRKEMIEKDTDSNQGFLTSKNRFVNRLQACKIAKEAKQFKFNGAKSVLFSEDLY